MRVPPYSRHAIVFLMSLMPILPTGAAGAPDASPLHAAAQKLVDAHLVSGVVALVGSGDNVIQVETAGYADIAARRPMTPDSLFWIASMSKAFTGTAVMMLVDEGKIRIDDPVAKYLPEFGVQMLVVERDADHVLLRKPPHPITIRDILTHTSGLGHRTPLEEEHIDLLSLRENVMTYPLLPLTFPAGQRYDYSNEGINTAGRIVEVVSGVPFDVFLRERILGPLGMKDTTFHPDAGQIARLAKSYGPDPGPSGLAELPIDQLSSPLDNPLRGISPAGGLFSTADDIYRFCRMIYHEGSYGGRRYLSRSAVDMMTATQIGQLPMDNTMDYGYGFGWLTRRKVSRANDPVNLGSFGAGGAYNTNMWINRPRNLITVWLVQQENYPESKRKIVRNTLMKAAVGAYGKSPPI